MKEKNSRMMLAVAFVGFAFLTFDTSRVTAAPGDLDLTFGNGGRIPPPSGFPTSSAAFGVAVQPDQKIVILGSRNNFIWGFFLSRYLPNGTLDTTFGNNGSVFNSDFDAASLALQPDGKIVLVGGSHILRYLPEGSLDTTFDGDGVVDFSAFRDCKLAIQNDGKIIVAGTKQIGPNHGDPALFGLARLNPDGSFDTSFGLGGILTTEFHYETSYLGDIAIQGDGKIVATGSTSTYDSSGICGPCNIALSRYNIEGSLDSSFGTSGRVVTPGGPYNYLQGSGVTFQADNKIVIAAHYSGALDSGGLVLRYLSSGSLDASFGGSGQVLTPNLAPFSIAVQSNGKILVAGGTTDYDPSYSNHEVGRLLANGVFDPTFGTSGRVTTAFPNFPQGFYINGRARDMAVQADGKIVTAGNWSGTDWDGNEYWSYPAIARYIGDSATAPNARFDFDGDGRSDVSVFRPSDHVWYLDRSRDGFTAVQFGASPDQITPADFDGDGKADVAVYRAETGTWYWLNSSNGAFKAAQFGVVEDRPTPADYDGDGRADISAFRPSNGTWYRLNSSNGSFYAVQFGASEDKPTIGDFDGDGRADIAVWRPLNGVWYRLNSSNGAFVAAAFGLSGDLITPEDFDGDGMTDIAVYRPSSGTWFWLNSSNGAFNSAEFGTSEDIASAADYDGDGKSDISVFRPSDGVWYRLNSSNGSFVAVQFGLSGDRPTPAAFRY